ncbi:putative toxin biosynthesis protein [Aspergillus saccharolyticus JOP 1030-1]|uniref:Putative toxin biosynthesis protein n=1 Tax=Aspergillus saccharolyticus JOP 1030-1 TaxID=1450539 RepID=A0A318Z763_9EURO|nr:putative toxin biosynthesis protein [Aspergillus saccharolyticus JOP 1030-1]PYH40573.1 putative toxin biosynthesis protein [Aspergillus saccharolyticus JOP 1030-1]
MDTGPFRIIDHSIPGQHIRDHHHAIKGRQETPLRLAIKQYVPVDRPDPIPEHAVTIIGAHGTGFPKELYEPLWEELYAQMKLHSIPLRAIWVADVSNQGASGVLNEYVQGDHTHWFDHSRDLLHMVNHFRDEISRPIVGFAHSMGCAQLVQLSIMHPRLLSTLILIEPVILDFAGRTADSPNPSRPAALRKDLWPSRPAAEAALRKSLLRKWDPRAAVRYLQFGLRDLPTRLYPDVDQPTTPADAGPATTTTNPQTNPSAAAAAAAAAPPAVTLTTTKHHEAWSYSVPNLEPASAQLDYLLLPDWDAEFERPFLVSRPECQASMRNLPFVRPSVLWVFGGRSYLSPPGEQEKKVRLTGSGTGGSGGVQEGRVKKAVLEKGSHMLVVEDVEWCAKTAAGWLGRWFERYEREERFWRDYRSRKSEGEEMLRASKEGLEASLASLGVERPRSKGKL